MEKWVDIPPLDRPRVIHRGQGRLHMLTECELDILDALSIMGRASLSSICERLSGIQSYDAIRKTVKRLENFRPSYIRCIGEVQTNNPNPVRIFTITRRGERVLTQSLNALIRDMEENGTDGIRSKPKRR